MSENSEERIRPVMPNDKDMEAAFKRILKADKYIVITINQEENGMETARLQNEASVEYTANELEFWAEIFRGKAQTESDLKDILKDNDITGQ